MSPLLGSSHTTPPTMFLDLFNSSVYWRMKVGRAPWAVLFLRMLELGQLSPPMFGKTSTFTSLGYQLFWGKDHDPQSSTIYSNHSAGFWFFSKQPLVPLDKLLIFDAERSRLYICVHECPCAHLHFSHLWSLWVGGSTWHYAHNVFPS